jgi:deoxycytidylate deaminase
MPKAPTPNARYLEGAEEKAALEHLARAAEVARDAECLRAKCGVVIADAQGEEIGAGFNGPPDGRLDQRRCERKHELGDGFKSDRTCCTHAEQRAILDAVRRNPDRVRGGRLYFCRVSDAGDVKRSGTPYCTVCSKAALEAGLAEFVLWHQEGVCVYPADEYNDLSYRYGQSAGQPSKAQIRASMALMLKDALEFTPLERFDEPKRQALLAGLDALVHDRSDVRIEEKIFQGLLDARFDVTVPFDEGVFAAKPAGQD